MELLRPGARLGERYRLDARIGAGGMGEVWRAADEVLGRIVAVKVMLPGVAADPGFARRFLAEATAMARVSHGAVASIHDYGTSAGVPYLVMEFVDGESLAQLLARVGRIGPADTMRLIAQAADGLQAVHDRGIVHRDIKPANLLIRRDGSVVLTDFGIAWRADASRLTASGAVLGTPSYLSPEQVLGEDATVRSDVYALGLTAYECLAGERPFAGDNPYAVALRRLQSAPKTIGITLPAPVLLVVERALATDPAHRWPSAAALAAAARDAAAGVVPASPAPASASPASASPASASAPPASAPPASPASASPALAFPVPPSPASAFPVPAFPVPASPAPAVASPGRRWRVALAAAVAALAVGAVALWGFTRDDGGGAAAGPAPSGGVATVPAGFTPCGTRYCPAAPMCWAGLTAIGGEAHSPRPLACAEDHRWETFAAVELPAGVDGTPPDELINRTDVAAACSAAVLASRSHDRAATASWIRTAWPVDLPGAGRRLLHCLAQPPSHESAGAAF